MSAQVEDNIARACGGLFEQFPERRPTYPLDACTINRLRPYYKLNTLPLDDGVIHERLCSSRNIFRGAAMAARPPAEERSTTVTLAMRQQRL
jgi:hypothetical protein